MIEELIERQDVKLELSLRKLDLSLSICMFNIKGRTANFIIQLHYADICCCVSNILAIHQHKFHSLQHATRHIVT